MQQRLSRRRDTNSFEALMEAVSAPDGDGAFHLVEGGMGEETERLPIGEVRRHDDGSNVRGRLGRIAGERDVLVVDHGPVVMRDAAGMTHPRPPAIIVETLDATVVGRSGRPCAPADDLDDAHSERVVHGDEVGDVEPDRRPDVHRPLLVEPGERPGDLACTRVERHSKSVEFFQRRMKNGHDPLQW